MWLNPQKTADLVTFTEEILNGKLHFLCSVYYQKSTIYYPELNINSITEFNVHNAFKKLIFSICLIRMRKLLASYNCPSTVS